jgi:hypothetical protein
VESVFTPATHFFFLTLTNPPFRASFLSPLSGVFLRNFCPFFTRLRKAYSNRLLSALYFAALAGFSRTKRAFFLATHRTLDTLASGLSILFPSTGTFLLWHDFLLLRGFRGETLTRGCVKALMAEGADTQCRRAARIPSAIRFLASLGPFTLMIRYCSPLSS